MSIYNDNLMDHYRNPRNYGCGKCQTNCASHMHNPSCGDKILLKLNVENGKIKDVCFEGYGCALSTASASMLTEHVKGLTLEQAKSLKVQDVIRLLDIEVSSARSKCASLPFEALQEAIKSQME